MTGWQGQLAMALDQMLDAKVLAFAPVLLEALYRAGIGLCWPSQASHWFYQSTIQIRSSAEPGKLYRGMQVGTYDGVLRCRDLDELNSMRDRFRRLARDSSPWVSLEAKVKPKDWPLFEKLLCLQSCVLGLVPDKRDKEEARQRLLALLETRYRVGLYSCSPAGKPRPIGWPSFEDLMLKSVHNPAAIPPVVWLVGADQAAPRQLLEVGCRLAELGKRLILEASAPRASSHIMWLCSAFAGSTWPMGNIVRGHDGVGPPGPAPVQPMGIPGDDAAARYRGGQSDDVAGANRSPDVSEPDSTDGRFDRLRRGTSPWVSLGAAVRSKDWPLFEKLLCLRSCVLGLVLGKKERQEGRLRLRSLLEARHAVGIYSCKRGAKSRSTRRPSWQVLARASEREPVAVPDIAWLIGADKAPPQQLLEIGIRLAERGKRLVFEASTPHAGDRIAWLCRAFAGPVWNLGSILRGGKGIKPLGPTPVRFKELPGDKVVARYAEAFSQEAETVLVCGSPAEVERLTQAIRSPMLRRATSKGLGVYPLLRLTDTGWPEAKKRDPSQYEVGMWVRFRRKVRSYCPEERVQVVWRQKDMVFTGRRFGLDTYLPLTHPQHMEVYFGTYEQVCSGELLRITSYQRANEKQRFDAGELVQISDGRPAGSLTPGGQPADARGRVRTTSGKWLQEDSGLWTFGYCTTPDQPPLRVKQVLVLPTAVDQLDPALWLPRIRAGGSVVGVGVPQKTLEARWGFSLPGRSLKRRRQRGVTQSLALVQPRPALPKPRKGGLKITATEEAQSIIRPPKPTPRKAGMRLPPPARQPAPEGSTRSAQPSPGSSEGNARGIRIFPRSNNECISHSCICKPRCVGGRALLSPARRVPLRRLSPIPVRRTAPHPQGRVAGHAVREVR